MTTTLNLLPERLDIDLQRGAPLTLVLTVTEKGTGFPVNLSTSTIEAAVVPRSEGAGVPLAPAVSGADHNVLTLELGTSSSAILVESGYLISVTVDSFPWLGGVLKVHRPGSSKASAGYTAAFEVTTEGANIAVTVQAVIESGGGGGGGGANLAWVAASSTVTSDSGADATLTAATASLPGLMTAAQFTKLNGVEAGAQVTKMPVAGTTGQILAKSSGANYATGWVDAPSDGVPTSRQITTTAPLTGGGDLTANRTLDISAFTTTVKGAVPPPGTLAGSFLKDDGTWGLPPSAASGAAGVFPFSYNVSTAETITGNQMRGNVFPITGATKLWVSETTTDGLNVAVGLGRIKVGGQVYVQDFSDATKFALFNVTADATDKGSYWEITVALASSGGSLTAGKVALQSLTPVVDYTAAISALKSTVYASVVHGATAGTARPTGYAGVIWYGSVQPTNAVAPDIVIRTDEAV